jgi:hypothetical protein
VDRCEGEDSVGVGQSGDDCGEEVELGAGISIGPIAWALLGAAKVVRVRSVARKWSSEPVLEKSVKNT